jgi:type IV secretory pathway component VirB8
VGNFAYSAVETIVIVSTNTGTVRVSKDNAAVETDSVSGEEFVVLKLLSGKGGHTINNGSVVAMIQSRKISSSLAVTAWIFLVVAIGAVVVLVKIKKKSVA